MTPAVVRATLRRMASPRAREIVIRLCRVSPTHHRMELVRADGEVLRLGTGGLVAGAFDQARYEGGAVTLAPGDRLCLFTDGLPEAESADGVEFGDARLVDVVSAGRTLPAATMVDRLFDAVAAAVDGPCHDDATAESAAAPADWDEDDEPHRRAA